MSDRLLGEIVTPNVISVSPASSISESLNLMRDKRISCVVVVEDKCPVGILTERNILWAAAHRGLDFSDRPVSDLMSSPVTTVTENMFIYEAYHLLTKKRMRHLVVVNDLGKAVGVITPSNVVEQLGCDYLSEIKKISQIMNTDVITAPGDLSAREAVRRMADRSISCIVVTRDKRPVGILTERDVVRLLCGAPGLGRLKLYDLMSCPVLSIDLDRPAFEAALIMKKRKVRRLAVVDDDQILKGLVTQSDIINGLESKYVRTLKHVLKEKDVMLEEVGRNLVEKTIFLDNILRSSMGMGIAATDESFRVTYFNPAAERFFGVEAKDVIGRDMREIHVQREVDLGRLMRALESVGPEASPEFSLRTERDGEKFTHQARVSGIWDKDLSLCGFVLMVVDVTERERAKEAVATLTHDLENQVVERTKDLSRKARLLERANQRLLSLDELKSSFLSSVSHELRTPLTSLLGFAKLIDRDFAKLFVPLTEGDAALTKKAGRVRQNIDVLVYEGERLTRLINDFLDLSKIESGRMEWRDSNISLEKIIRNAAKASQGLFTANPDVILAIDVECGLPEVFADPDKLEQVLLNLIGNAAKFTRQGSVTVSAKRLDNGLVRVGVVDTGEGIPAKDVEKVFDKFHQAGREEEGGKAHKGTGLGLAICREIIERYGGRIWAEPGNDRGAAVYFEFPADACLITEDRRRSLYARRLDEAGMLDSEKPLILVADDDPAVTSFFIQFMESEGFRVVAAHDGESALRAARDIHPDCIIMDIAMPGMNGLEAIRSLRRDENLKGIPVLVISGAVEREIEGADVTMQKPVDRNKLIETVDGLLKRRRMDGPVIVA